MSDTAIGRGDDMPGGVVDRGAHGRDDLVILGDPDHSLKEVNPV